MLLPGRDHRIQRCYITTELRCRRRIYRTSCHPRLSRKHRTGTSKYRIASGIGHGTNPASAIQCGYTTVTVKCDENGNIDLEDFRAKAEANKDNLAASMITYPSTHGIFEVDIKEMCDIVHACGGQLYMVPI